MQGAHLAHLAHHAPLPPLQLRFALQVPALLLIYAANAVLLPAACRERMGGAADSLSTCVAVG